MKEMGELISKVYANGAKLLVLDGGLAVDGGIPEDLREEVRAHGYELLEALTADPLEGVGWDARTALYRQALRWLDGEIKKLDPKGAGRKRAAIETLCHQDVADRFNTDWCDGDFDRFRVALRKYVRAGLRAARRKDQGARTKRKSNMKTATGI